MKWANADDVPSLSPDEPSGVEISRKNFINPVIIVDIISTLALTKLKLQNDVFSSILGELYLANISILPELLKD